MNAKDIEDLVKSQITKTGKFHELVKLDALKPVKAFSVKTADHNINIRIRDTAKLPDLTLFKGCRPRTTLDGQPSLSLPTVIVKNFDAINKNLATWLAASKENSKVFLENPLQAIEKAGVKLDRASLKELQTLHTDAKSKILVSPEVNELKINVEYKKGTRSLNQDRTTTTK